MSHSLNTYKPFYLRALWAPLFWFVLYGLAIWSYGFNNIPFIRPLPLVDAIVFFILILSLPSWVRFLRATVVRHLLLLLLLLSVVVGTRLLVDFPTYGKLAARDALFALELWILFPAIVIGYRFSGHSLVKKLTILFALSVAWFLLYPAREVLFQISPVVGVQRPTPLFAWTTAGPLSVVAFFWFWGLGQGFHAVLLGAFSFLSLLFYQSRGAYLAFALTLFSGLLLKLPPLRRLSRFLLIIVVLLFALPLAGSVQGRLGERVGFSAAIAQLETLLGKEGPGAGSFKHRLRAWPEVVSLVLQHPYGWLVGVGLGRDLFLGFSVGEGVLVRKPHNDFLELWARTGIFGLIAYTALVFYLLVLALHAVRKSFSNLWFLALQVAMLVASFSQPALGFAYCTVIWMGLSGLWLGHQIRAGVRS